MGSSFGLSTTPLGRAIFKQACEGRVFKVVSGITFIMSTTTKITSDNNPIINQ